MICRLGRISLGKVSEPLRRTSSFRILFHIRSWRTKPLKDGRKEHELPSVEILSPPRMLLLLEDTNFLKDLFLVNLIVCKAFVPLKIFFERFLESEDAELHRRPNRYN